ncbi:VOC family protein [Glaciibacter superstes]|uniref:VOC family protein n=1 Tax=Glaciibacter superstes TaxID=501023 RepID=UPI001B7F8824|nr:VOC family protein [Glaciibacter superstes]
MTIPDIAGIHHVTLTVSDAPASAEWYRDVLGFSILRQVAQNELTKVMLARQGLSLILVDHGDQAVPGDFSERRNGLDHLGFAVADQVTLESWVSHLDSVGVPHSPVTQGSSGLLIAFRDPDNIALEFYTQPIG